MVYDLAEVGGRKSKGYRFFESQGSGPVLPPIAGYSGWWDASQVTGVADAAALASWPDLSGNGHHFTASGSARPTFYKTTSGKLVNGLPAISFDGVANTMVTAAFALSQPFSVYLVAVTNGGDANDGIPIVDSAFGWVMELGWVSFPTPETYAGAALPSTNAFVLGTNVAAAIFNGASSFNNFNGVVTAGDAGTGSQTALELATNTFGAFTEIDLCELIIFPVDHTELQAASVMAYLANKWGDPLPSAPISVGTLLLNSDFTQGGYDSDIWYPNWFDDAVQGQSDGTASGVPSEGIGDVQSLTSNLDFSGGTMKLSLSDSTHGAVITTDQRMTFAHAPPGYTGFAYQNGYAEALCYFYGSDATHNYNWPAWWQTCQSANWPTDGEIDIAEGLGTIQFNYWGPPVPPSSSPDGQNGNFGGNFCNAWHYFGIHWTPTGGTDGGGNIDYYVDGVLVGSHSTNIVSAEHFLFLNAGNGSDGGSFNAGVTLEVKTVRVWALP